jgi:hypothetical protein
VITSPSPSVRPSVHEHGPPPRHARRRGSWGQDEPRQAKPRHGYGRTPGCSPIPPRGAPGLAGGRGVGPAPPAPPPPSVRPGKPTRLTPPHPTWRARPPRGNPARPLLLPRHPVAGRHVRPSAWLSSRVPESEDPEPTSLSGCPCLTWRAQGRDSAAAARHVAPHRRLLIILAARLIGGFVC